MFRRVNEFKAMLMSFIKCFPPFERPIDVRAQIVPNDENPFARVLYRDGFHKGFERFCVTMCNDLANDFARAHVECGK